MRLEIDDEQREVIHAALQLYLTESEKRKTSGENPTMDQQEFWRRRDIAKALILDVRFPCSG